MQLMLSKCSPSGGPPQPNAGHRACAALEQSGRLALTITQNIDALHQAAGSTHVIEAHGGVHSTRCLECDATTPMRDTLERVERGEAEPTCEECGGLLKPDVVFFGEPLPFEKMLQAQDCVARCDALIAVGSTLSVSPVNQLVRRARVPFVSS